MAQRSGAPPRPLVLEATSALLVPAALYGFTRLFLDGSALVPIVGAALLSTLLAAVLRRLHVPLSLAALGSILGLGLLVQQRYAPGTARAGIVPTAETADALRLLLETGVERFRATKAPVPAEAPFVAGAMVAAWAAAFLTDWGAHRLRLAFEPVLPAGLLFVFGSIYGADTGQVTTTAVFAAAALAWAVSQRTMRLANERAWLTIDRRRGPTGVAQGALGLGAAAIVFGLVAGPLIPGADAEELVRFRTRSDPSRVVLSPFVDIESRLVDQTAVELFQVRAERPAYWRMAGLDLYEDDIWKVFSNFTPTDGSLPGAETRAGTTVAVRQDVTISNLSGEWLPAAYAPRSVEVDEVGVTWNGETGSLITAENGAIVEGLTYTVESVLPIFTVAEIEAAPSTVPADIAERFLPLPDDLPDIVADEATRITAGATTRFEQMIALQSFFREFDYSVRLGARNPDLDPIEQFLAERIGFCQQFAGTFALMARSLGAPARVAVGFTWGDPIGPPDEDGLTAYSVSGRQTHAWPEVWFEGLGWVAFEPTPGRGAPAAAAYTGVAAQQDSLVQPDDPSGPTTTTTEAGGNLAIPSTTDLGDLLDLEANGVDGGTAGTVTTDDGIDVPWRLVLPVLAVGGYVLGASAFHRWRRDRRLRLAATNAERIDAAWADMVETAEGLAYRRVDDETELEFADRVGADRRLDAEALRRLAHLTSAARYGPEPSATSVEHARTLADDLIGQLRSSGDRSRWWRRDLDPRRLVRPTHRTLRAERALPDPVRSLDAAPIDLEPIEHRPVEAGTTAD